MSQYATLKAAITAAIKQNGNNEITGNLLQQQLLAMVNSLGANYQYVDIATPATNPGTPDQNVFYIASTAGTYANFGGLVLADGEIAIFKYNGAWSKDSTGAATQESVSQLGQKVGNVDDIYTSIPEDGDGVGFYQLVSGELVVDSSGISFRYYHFSDISAFAGKLIRLRAGDMRENHYTYFCFIKLSDNTYVELYKNTSFIKEKYANYYSIQLPENVTDLYISWAKTEEGISLIPMFAVEPLDSKNYDIQEKLDDTTKILDDYISLRGIDFNVEGANLNMSKFIRHLSFDIPSAVKDHELVLAFLGLNNDRFYLGIKDVTEEKLIGNAFVRNRTTVPTSGIEEFEFTHLGSSAAASYQLSNIKLIVDWAYYPGWYTGTPAYKVGTTSNLAFNRTISKINRVISNSYHFDVTPDGFGYYDYTGVIQTNNTWQHKDIDISEYRGKLLRIRAGDFESSVNFTLYCIIVLSDSSIVEVRSNNVTVLKTKDYHLIRIPDNANVLKISFGNSNSMTLYPYLSYEPNDEYLYSILSVKGFVCTDIRYNSCILGIDIDIPDNKKQNVLVLRQFGVYTDNHRFYIEAYDMTENKRLGYAYYGNYNPIPSMGVKVFDFTSFTSGEASYQLGRLRIAIDWSKYDAELYYANVYDKIYLSYIDAASFFYLYDQIKDFDNLDIENNVPVLPSHLFLLSDKQMPLYKNSLMTKYKANIADIDINIKSDNTAPNGRKVLEINEPTYFSVNDFGNDATIFLQRDSVLNKLIYKDIKVFKKDTSLLSGKTFTLMALGDSLTQGTFSGGTARNGWRTTPPCMVAQGLLPYNVTTQFIGSIVRTYYNEDSQPVTLRYEGRGGWRYRTYVGLESKYAGINQTIAASQTKHEWVEGVDGSINDIKSINPFLYPATEDDLINNPEWCFHFVEGNTEYNKSYAEDSSLGDYVIFDPVRYFSLRQIDVPDVLTIALGTNEWYLNEYGGFDNAKATACAEFMIKQFRKVSANMNIVVIPLNNFPTSRESDWENYAMPLCSNVIRVCDELIAAGDEHLFICPIYAQGSRKLGYNGTIGSASNLSSLNDTKQIEVDTNVHVLYEQDDSNYDYRDSLVACIANLIN